jgi:predicted N-acetyltransferase YhbS
MGSTTVLIRRAHYDDRAAIEAMVARCSTRTKQRRFQGGTRTTPREYLERVCDPRPGDLHLVALVSSRHVVALASLCDGELGLLVEDEWQHAGIGARLTRRLLAHARAAGARTVVAEIAAGNEGVLASLRRLRPRRVVSRLDGYHVELDPWRRAA